MTLDYHMQPHFYFAIYLSFYTSRQQRRQGRNIHDAEIRKHKNIDYCEGDGEEDLVLLRKNNRDMMWSDSGLQVAYDELHGLWADPDGAIYDDEQGLDVMKLLSSSLLSFFIMLDL